jgi:scavenger receptor class B, member 1
LPVGPHLYFPTGTIKANLRPKKEPPSKHATSLQVDLVWNNNGTVTYKQVRTFQFVPDQSKGSLDDRLVLLNIPAATVGATAQNLPKITRGLMNLGLKAIGENLFVEKTAGEILFDGYDDPVLKAAEFIHKFNVPIPGIMDKFGFYYGRNGSDWWDGVFNMFTGTNNLHRLGEIASWNFSANTGFFPRPCGDVRGVGDFFPPYMPDTTVELFSNDLCRPIELSFNGWDSVKGVNGKRYRVEPSYFANSDENPANYCFESGPSPLPSGVYNASSCRFGAPIFMSEPHFYQVSML